MTDLRALAMGIYKMSQAVSKTDQTCQDLIVTSIAFAEASMGDSPLRDEWMDEFMRIATKGA